MLANQYERNVLRVPVTARAGAWASGITVDWNSVAYCKKLPSKMERVILKLVGLSKRIDARSLSVI